MQIECMRTEVRSGSCIYPVYVGFAIAADIARVSVAPAFSPNTTHQGIAENISSQPVRDWQRPINAERVSGIADAFNDTGALMPNPVLLAKNAFVKKISVEPKLIHGYPTANFVVHIQEDDAIPEQRPLWILDGQHRITGLSQSLQRHNAVPVVFLLDDAAGTYAPPQLASIFAQVTTAATKLDELHNEWLTYAFNLGRYANSKESRSAFACAVELCRRASWGQINNPFFNQVQFNEHQPVGPSEATIKGFFFTCKEFADLISKFYYRNTAQFPHLSPPDLALEIVKGYIALNHSIQNHSNSVFFAIDRKKQQRIMQEAFVAGLLTRTLRYGPTADYNDLFQKLNFQLTNWEFSWVTSLSGRANSISKRIAIEVFEEAFISSKLPLGSNNLADYLRGNGAMIKLTCSKVNADGRPMRSGRTVYEALRGSTGSHPVGATPHIKVTESTSNIGEFEIVDAKKRGRAVAYKEFSKRGLILGDDTPQPLDVVVVMQHYGELYSQAEITFNW